MGIKHEKDRFALLFYSLSDDLMGRYRGGLTYSQAYFDALRRCQRHHRRVCGGEDFYESDSFKPYDILYAYREQDGRCCWCGKLLRSIFSLDHLRPVALNGKNTPDNIGISCKPCNSKKGARIQEVEMPNPKPNQAGLTPFNSKSASETASKPRIASEPVIRKQFTLRADQVAWLDSYEGNSSALIRKLLDGYITR